MLIHVLYISLRFSLYSPLVCSFSFSFYVFIHAFFICLPVHLYLYYYFFLLLYYFKPFQFLFEYDVYNFNHLFAADHSSLVSGNCREPRQHGGACEGQETDDTAEAALGAQRNKQNYIAAMCCGEKIALGSVTMLLGSASSYLYLTFLFLNFILLFLDA